MKFNEKLKFLREKKCLTQDDVADKIGITRQSVSKWETGINEPDIDTLKKLCVILDCSIEELINDDKDVIVPKEIKSEKISKGLFYASISLCIITILSLLIFIRAMDEQIIQHIGFNGNKTIGPKWIAFVLLIQPLFGLFFNIVMRLFSKNNKYYKNQKVLLQSVAFALQILMLIMTFVEVFIMDTYTENESLNLLITNVIVICFSATIFMHPKFNKRNVLFGVKTNFTLSNDEAWKKINSFACISLSIYSIISYVFMMIFFDWEYAYNLIYFVFVVVAIIIVYHEIVRHKFKKLDANKDK